MPRGWCLIEDACHAVLDPASQDAAHEPVTAAGLECSANASTAGSSMVAWNRHRAHSSFMTLASPTIGPGGDLPNASYAASEYQGNGELPNLTIDQGGVKRTKAFLIVAQDSDGIAEENGEVYPLWVRANINPLQATSPTDPGVGVDVVPYRGVKIDDDYIHRIFWRLYALKEKIPSHIIANGWSTGEKNPPNREGIHEYLESNGILRPEHRVGDKSEFLTVAVRKELPPWMKGCGSIPATRQAGYQYDESPFNSCQKQPKTKKTSAVSDSCSIQ